MKGRKSKSWAMAYCGMAAALSVALKMCIRDRPYYYQYETYKSQEAQKAFDASPYQAAGYSDEQIKALMEQNQSEVEALYYLSLIHIFNFDLTPYIEGE